MHCGCTWIIEDRIVNLMSVDALVSRRWQNNLTGDDELADKNFGGIRLFGYDIRSEFYIFLMPSTYFDEFRPLSSCQNALRFISAIPLLLGVQPQINPEHSISTSVPSGSSLTPTQVRTYVETQSVSQCRYALPRHASRPSFSKSLKVMRRGASASSCRRRANHKRYYNASSFHAPATASCFFSVNTHNSIIHTQTYRLRIRNHLPIHLIYSREISHVGQEYVDLDCLSQTGAAGFEYCREVFDDLCLLRGKVQGEEC